MLRNAELVTTVLTDITSMKTTKSNYFDTINPRSSNENVYVISQLQIIY